MIYQWRIKRRILYWYGQLKKLEKRIAVERSGANIGFYKAEIDRIDEAVSIIPVPVLYSEQFYSLRSAVDLVRQRVYGRM